MMKRSRHLSNLPGFAMADAVGRDTGSGGVL